MILLELFSGIGGFAKGFEQAGYKFTKHYFSEIDKHAIANYKYNYPNAEHIGSVTDVSGRDIERPNIITFGFPCQDLSIAGKRKGFTGKRSSLFYEAMRIVEETKPDIFIFENVKGLFSSHNGKDFIAVLRTIADIGLYECEWQMLNTKWVLPQNRERIYFVGHLAGRSKPRVFPISKNDSILKRKTESAISQSQTKDSYATCISPKADGRADGTYINVIGNLKGEGRHEVHNVNDTNGKITKIIVHNTMPRKGLSSAVILKQRNNIRRLTEIECERLQGFPDNWTQFGNYDGEIKKIAKSQRYKLLGNAVTVNIVQLIAERLLK